MIVIINLHGVQTLSMLMIYSEYAYILFIQLMTVFRLGDQYVIMLYLM